MNLEGKEQKEVLDCFIQQAIDEVEAMVEKYGEEYVIKKMHECDTSDFENFGEEEFFEPKYLNEEEMEELKQHYNPGEEYEEYCRGMISAPNNTQIPNYLLEEYLQEVDSLSELKTVLAIARATLCYPFNFGLTKKHLSKLTNTDEKDIEKSIKTLILKGLIEEEVKDNQTKYFYHYYFEEEEE